MSFSVLYQSRRSPVFKSLNFRDDYRNSVEFKTISTLKGEAPNSIIAGGYLGDPTPSDPNEIINANREAYAGPCVRMTFKIGDKYVLILNQSEDGDYIVSGDPFSRNSEDDFGPTSAWRRAIQTYLSIQENPDRMAQLQVMQYITIKGLSKSATPFEKQLGEDAFIHLTSIHPDKPTEWLIAQYEDTGQTFRTLADAIEGTQEQEVGELTDFIMGDRGPPEGVKSTILRALSRGDHAEARYIFDDLVKGDVPDTAILGAAVSFYILQKDYDAAKSAMSDHLLWLTATETPSRGPSLSSATWHAVGYGDNRKVPDDFYEWFDKQMIALCFMRNNTERCNYKLDDASPLLSDPENHRRELLALASNDDVSSWALSQAKQLKTNNVSVHEDDWDLPLTLLLADYDPKKSEFINQLACGSTSERYMLIKKLGEALRYSARDLLREMMASPQDNDIRKVIFESAVRHAADGMSTSRWANADDAYEYAKSDDTLPLTHARDPILQCTRDYNARYSDTPIPH